jgi:hypothetical protein
MTTSLASLLVHRRVPRATAVAGVTGLKRLAVLLVALVALLSGCKIDTSV